MPLLIVLLVLALLGAWVAIAGVDTRDGADGETTLGRRRHRETTWW